MPDIYFSVLEPALREIGHRWAIGVLNVAEEHYATAVAQSILDGLSRQLPRRRATAASRSSPARPKSSMRWACGWSRTSWRPTAGRCCCSAPARPRATSPRSSESEQPDVVALSTATPGVLDGVVEVIRALAALKPRPCIVAGGQFWTAETSPTALDFGADLVLQDPRELVAVLTSGTRRVASSDDLSRSASRRSHRSPEWKSRNVCADSGVIPVIPATRCSPPAVPRCVGLGFHGV